MKELIQQLALIAAILQGWLMGWNRRRKWQVVEVTIPSGASGATYTATSVTLNSGYKKMLGLYIPEADSFNPEIAMEVSNSAGTLHDLIRLRHYVVNTAVEPDRRLVRIPAPADGAQLTLKFTNLALTADDTTISVAILLEAE